MDLLAYNIFEQKVEMKSICHETWSSQVFLYVCIAADNLELSEPKYTDEAVVQGGVFSRCGGPFQVWNINF